MRVITLPADVTSRQVARRIVPAGAGSDAVVVNATATIRHGSAGIDELVKKLLATGVHRVIVVNASPGLRRALEVIHRVRTRPERTFLMLFQEVSADKLLRPV